MAFGVMLKLLAEGLLRSVGIFMLTLIFSLPLGVFVALGRMSKNKILSKITGAFISVMRGTPLILQLTAVYFLPYYIFKLPIAGWRYPAIIVGFSVNYAAYFAEIYRSGIGAIPKGQYEAANILGYSKAQTFMKIILPQVVKIILPSVTNEIITLVKDTSLAFTISYAEMYTVASQIASKETSFMPFIVAAVFYYVFNFVVAKTMEKAEKALSYYH